MYCNAELGEFAKHYNAFRKLNTRIVAVSVDPLAKARQTKERLKIPFPVLSDSERTAMRLYGTRLVGYTRFEREPIDAATLILIDKSGTIRWIHQSKDYRIRPSISRDIEEVRKIQ